MSLPTVLEKINARKLEEIAERSRHTPIELLMERTANLEPSRGFVEALQQKLAAELPAVIGEIKKASPSKGVIRQDFVPAEIAKSYEQAGAACLSVLTDKDFFMGSEDYLKQAKTASSLPIIRKDFIVHPYQIYEARDMGADAVLLIVASLPQSILFKLNDLAHLTGMDVLIEVHDEQELSLALQTENQLIGINNRNLHNFETSLDTTIRLLNQIPDDRLVITESGIYQRTDVECMRKAGVNSFLVGEAFMRCEDPGGELRNLFF